MRPIPMLTIVLLSVAVVSTTVAPAASEIPTAAAPEASGIPIAAAPEASVIPTAAAPAATGSPTTAVRAPWAGDGHTIVCEIAFLRLTDAGRDLVFAARRHDPEPSQTFRESCSWPDESRRTDHKATYEYHFMNVVVPGADEVVMERDCGNYDCVQAAIVRYANYVAMDPGDSDSMRIRRANALKFVGHFVGDLHQPLHVGYAHDRGGNDHPVDFYGEADVNLHAVWDFHIPDRMGYFEDPVATARQLNDEISLAEATAWADFDVVGWSRESYEVVKDLVYDVPIGGAIGNDYYERAVPIVERRFKQAGVRLAHLLNSAADGTLELPSLFGSH